MTRNNGACYCEDEITFTLPSSIDVESIQGNGERRARIAFVGHLMTTGMDSSMFVRINKKELQAKISAGAEKAAFDFFRPFIEIDHSYTPQKLSKGYRWKKEVMESGIKGHTFKAPRLRKRLGEKRNEVRSEYSNTEKALEEVMETAELPIDLDEVVSRIPPKPKVKSEVHRKFTILASGMQIQNGEMGLIKTSSNTGRVHCSINRLSSYLRGMLTLDGECVVELDLASSQPYFLAGMFKSPALREAVEAGEFYLRINERMTVPADFSNRFEYGDFKQGVLATLYARPINGQEYWKDEGNRSGIILAAMDKAFPGIAMFLDIYRKTKGDTALSIALQNAESEVFIGAVLPMLQKEGVSAVPIHDAILCQAKYQEVVRRELEESLRRRTGLDPIVRSSLG